MKDPVRWWSPAAIAAILLVGSPIVAGLVGLVRDTAPNKWAWGTVLLVGGLGAFSLIRNLLGLRGSDTHSIHPIRWWHKALAIVAWVTAIAVKTLTAGESVLTAVLVAGICAAGFAVIALVIYCHDRFP